MNKNQGKRKIIAAIACTMMMAGGNLTGLESMQVFGATLSQNVNSLNKNRVESPAGKPINSKAAEKSLFETYKSNWTNYEGWNHREQMNLTNEQLKPFLERTEKEFLERFGIAVIGPKLEVGTCNFKNGKATNLFLEFSTEKEYFNAVNNNRTPNVEHKRYSSYFVNVDFEKGTGDLLSIGALGGIDEIRLKAFKDRALEAGEKYMNISSASEVPLNTLAMYDGDTNSTTLELKWAKPISKSSDKNLTVTFSNVDFMALDKGIGEMTSINTMEADDVRSISLSETKELPELTQAEKDFMLAQVKTFAGKANYSISGLQEAYVYDNFIGKVEDLFDWVDTGYIDFVFRLELPGYEGLSVLISRNGKIVNYNLLEDIEAYCQESAANHSSL